MALNSWAMVPSLLSYAIVVLVVYVLCLYLYRLFLHPLAEFPGPKLAAISNWYEFYWDVVQQGKFTEHIQTLHKQYGKMLTLLYTFPGQTDHVRLQARSFESPPRSSILTTQSTTKSSTNAPADGTDTPTLQHASVMAQTRSALYRTTCIVIGGNP